MHGIFNYYKHTSTSLVSGVNSFVCLNTVLVVSLQHLVMVAPRSAEAESGSD